MRLPRLRSWPVRACGLGSARPLGAAEEFRRLDAQASAEIDAGKYQAAEQTALALRCLAETQLAGEPRRRADALNTLACVYYNQGRYAEVEPLYRRALEIRERVLGGEHIDVAGSLNNLANLYWGLARYAEAEPLYRRTLEIREKVLGGKHPEVAGSLNNLANLYLVQGRFAEAVPLQQACAEIRERPSAPNTRPWRRASTTWRPSTMTRDAGTMPSRCSAGPESAAKGSWSGASPSGPEPGQPGEPLRGAGRYAEAEPLYRGALEIKEKILGPVHPAVADGLHNLASVYHDQERYAEAEPLYRRALAIREKTLPPGHPSAAATGQNVANLYRDQGRYARPSRSTARPWRSGKRRSGPNTLPWHRPSTAWRTCIVARGVMRRPIRSSYGRWTSWKSPRAGAPRCRRRIEQPVLLPWSANARPRPSRSSNGPCRFGLTRGSRRAIATAAITFARWSSGVWGRGPAPLMTCATPCNWPKSNALRRRRRARAGSVLHPLLRRLRTHGCVADRAGRHGRSLPRHGTRPRPVARGSNATGRRGSVGGRSRGRGRGLRRRHRKPKRAWQAWKDNYRSWTSEQTFRLAIVSDRPKPSRHTCVAEQDYAAAYADIRNASPAYRLAVGQDRQPVRLAELHRWAGQRQTLLLEYLLGSEGGYVLVIPGGETPRLESSPLPSSRHGHWAPRRAL